MPTAMGSNRFGCIKNGLGSPTLPGGADSFIMVLSVRSDEIGEVLVSDDGTDRTFESHTSRAREPNFLTEASVPQANSRSSRHNHLDVSGRQPLTSRGHMCDKSLSAGSRFDGHVVAARKRRLAASSCLMEEHLHSEIGRVVDEVARGMGGGTLRPPTRCKTTALPCR
jgi:hypothetical protein